MRGAFSSFFGHNHRLVPMAAKNRPNRPSNPVMLNRRGRRDYHIVDTLECGVRLVGSEVKSLRAGQASLAEGWVRASERPIGLTLHGVHIAEYPNASPTHQHEPIRIRALLAHRREIRKLADFARAAGNTLVPLKLYFSDGRAKILIGLARGKRKADKREDITKREAARDIDRAMRRK